jgi:hypothetical protein
MNQQRQQLQQEASGKGDLLDRIVSPLARLAKWSFHTAGVLAIAAIAMTAIRAIEAVLHR